MYSQILFIIFNIKTFIDRIEKDGFTFEISINPIYQEGNMTAKELPRAIKTVLLPDDLRAVLDVLLPIYKEEHLVKMQKAVQKLEERKFDTFIYDE